MAQHQIKRIIFGLIVAIAMTLTAITIWIKPVFGQEETGNFYHLLIDTQERMAQDDTFQVAIRLHTPIVDGERVFVLPDYTDDEVSRRISTIGEDYVCFDVIGGSTVSQNVFHSAISLVLDG